MDEQIKTTPPASVDTVVPQNMPLQPSMQKKSNSALILTVVILLAFAAVGGFAVGKNVNSPITNSGSIVAETETITPTPDPTANWNSSASNGVYSFKYPNETKYENVDQYNRVIYWGPSQKEGDHMSDGIYLQFSLVKIPDANLEKYLATKIANEEPLGKIIDPLTSTTVAGLPGYTYTHEGLGGNPKYIYLLYPGSTIAVEIVDFTIDPENIGYKNTVSQILSSFKFVTDEDLQTNEPTENYYTGDVSSVVPYKGLKFQDISVHNFKTLSAELNSADYIDNGNTVIDGYTFIATKGESFEFLAEEDRSSNPGSFIKTELYGHGPTVIKMDTRIGWGVPATTRYFYVVKGQNFYGPDSGSMYGKYKLSITQGEMVK